MVFHTVGLTGFLFYITAIWFTYRAFGIHITFEVTLNHARPSFSFATALKKGITSTLDTKVKDLWRLTAALLPLLNTSVKTIATWPRLSLS